MSTPEGQAENREEVRIVVSYQLENGISGRKIGGPTEIVFSGFDMAQLYQEIVRHMVNLEMNPENPAAIAVDTKVKVGDREMSFDDFSKEFYPRP